MNDMNIDKRKEALELVENVGMFFEQSGYLPSSARVYSLLMIWEEPDLHFDEIQEILNLSKGATSKAVNDLLQKELIKIFTKPGIRKKIYRVIRKPGQDSAKTFVLYLKAMKAHLQRIEDHKEKYDEKKVRFAEELNYFQRLIELLDKEL